MGWQCHVASQRRQRRLCKLFQVTYGVWRHHRLCERSPTWTHSVAIMKDGAVTSTGEGGGAPASDASPGMAPGASAGASSGASPGSILARPASSAPHIDGKPRSGSASHG